MTDSSVVDLYPDFMRLGGFDLNIFDCQILARFPGNRSLNDISEIFVSGS